MGSVGAERAYLDSIKGADREMQGYKALKKHGSENMRPLSRMIKRFRNNNH